MDKRPSFEDSNSPRPVALQLTPVVLLGAGMCRGGLVAYVVILSVGCALLRRFFSVGVGPWLGLCARRAVPILPRDVRRDAAESTARSPRSFLCRHLAQPLDAAWIWAVWFAWYLSWVAWHADAPREKETCALIATFSVWIPFGLILFRHHYAALRNSGRTSPPIVPALALAALESFFLLISAAILGVYVHLAAGGQF